MLEVAEWGAVCPRRYDPHGKCVAFVWYLVVPSRPMSMTRLRNLSVASAWWPPVSIRTPEIPSVSEERSREDLLAVPKH